MIKNHQSLFWQHSPWTTLRLPFPVFPWTWWSVSLRMAIKRSHLHLHWLNRNSWKRWTVGERRLWGHLRWEITAAFLAQSLVFLAHYCSSWFLSLKQINGEMEENVISGRFYLVWPTKASYFCTISVDELHGGHAGGQEQNRFLCLPTQLPCHVIASHATYPISSKVLFSQFRPRHVLFPRFSQTREL